MPDQVCVHNKSYLQEPTLDIIIIYITPAFMLSEMHWKSALGMVF